MGARYRALAGARARSVAAPIANRELQKSTGGGQKCSQLFPVEHEGRRGLLGPAWRAAGLTYQRADKVKSQIYLEALPLWTRAQISIPEHKQLLRELRLLERRTHRSGKETIDHGRNGSDDFANALCGVAVTLVGGRYRYDVTMNWVDGPPAASAADAEARAAAEFLEQRMRQHISRYGGNGYRGW